MKKLITLIVVIFPVITFSQKIDTLCVNQNDTSIFKRIDFIIKGPCVRPRAGVTYRLIKPVNNTYYIISNSKNQVVKEGIYKKENIPGRENSAGIYNAKDFSYNHNKLYAINYQKEGRNFKTEFYKGKGNLKYIRYFNKKSGTVEKKEIYKKNKLKETRFYCSYYANVYYSIVDGCRENCNPELYSELLKLTEKKVKKQKQKGRSFKGKKYVFKITKPIDLINSKKLEHFIKELEK